MKMIVATLCASAFVTALCAQNAQELTTPESFTSADGETLLYRLYQPKALPAGNTLPLVLFLHGAGERGTNNVSQLIHGITPMLDFMLAANEPAILLIPQCPTGMQWVNAPWNAPSHTMPDQPSLPMKLALALVREKMRSLPIDPARVYVTGVSMGGYGTWDAIQREPALFAAALPVCGGGDSACAASLKNMPIWIFHGEKDGAVPVTRSRDMYHALQACGGKVQYREYPNAGHGVWTPTYNDASVLTWLFAQRKPVCAAK